MAKKAGAINPVMDISGYEGRQEHVRQLKMPAIETIENKYSDRDYTVVYENPEMNSICPKTGLPDFANVKITYVPDKYLAELKSLKLYFTAYRNVGIFQEFATNKILDDFVKAVKPRQATVEAVWNARGGMGTRIVAEYRK